VKSKLGAKSFGRLSRRVGRINVPLKILNVRDCGRGGDGIKLGTWGRRSQVFGLKETPCGEGLGG